MVIKWRASNKAYVAAEMKKLSATGRPINRPIWWDFPRDPQAWESSSTFMFGDTFLASPILEAGVRRKTVYLPCPNATSNCSWRHVWTGELYSGNQTHTVDAPLATFPLFERQFT